MTARRSQFHRKVRDQANRLLQKYIRSGRFPRASGPCTDCGRSTWGANKVPLAMCYDHRDYSEVFSVEVVCYSCNGRRGSAWIPFVNVETLQVVRYREAA